jgi:hypothetical protein
MIARRHIGEHAEPAERIDALERLQHVGRHRVARGTVKAVAARDEVAIEPMCDAVLRPGQRWAVLDIVERDAFRLEMDRRAAFDRGSDQIARHLGLAVDGHRFAGQPLEVDAERIAVGRQGETAMDQTLRR